MRPLKYCGTVLVVMEYRDVEFILQTTFDFKTFRRFNIFQIDAAECRCYRFNRCYNFIGSLSVQFDVKDINIRELFEEIGFAFHYGFTSLGTDVSQTKNSRSVCNDRN